MVLVFLTSGELTLRAHLEAAGQTIKAGQEIRSVNISADAGKGYGIFEDLHGHKDGASLSNYLKAQCQKNYGTAIDAFLTHLVKEDKKMILKKRNEIAQIFLTRLKGDDAHGQVKRVVERFALRCCGWRIGDRMGYCRVAVGDCIEAAFTCFESWINDHRESGLSSSEEEKIVEQVRHFFESRSSRFDTFIAQSSFKGNRAGFRNEAQQGNTAGDYFVFTTTFKKEICENYESLG
ncbi:DNA/RNA helicase [Rickettsiella massiliensis]|uniref:DNA/RNA helicase n=1 Tax=Rickettsiella massiliensis TaxID=676517 RepID=UPI00029A5F29|nr:DNA/RNA helicase [Rickettsiella massiliensis]